MSDEIEYVNASVTCQCCKVVVEYEEPKGSTTVGTMPDGYLDGGDWYCNICWENNEFEHGACDHEDHWCEWCGEVHWPECPEPEAEDE